MTSQTPDTTAICCGCSREQKAKPNRDGAPKCPRGWKAVGDGLLCRECKAERFFIRAVRMKIVGVHPSDGGKQAAREMPELRAALSAAAKASARFGNWYVQRLFAADLAVAPLEKTKDNKSKLPPCPEIEGWYREAVAMFPDLSGGCLSGLSRSVRAWYSSRRWDALIGLSRSVESYRFGYLPVHVREQETRVEVDADGKYVLRISITPGQSWALSIYVDGRNLAYLRKIMAGDATKLAAKIVRRSGATLPGQPPKKAWYAQVSAMFPRTLGRRASHQEITLTLGHDPGCLLFGTLEGSDDVFEFPGVALKNTIVGGDKTDRALQQEHSLARGVWSKRKLSRWQRDRSEQSRSRQRKIKSQLQLAAAALARWCLAHDVTSVDYDTAPRGFVPHCPYRELRDALTHALEPHGIGLHVLEPAEVGDD